MSRALATLLALAALLAGALWYVTSTRAPSLAEGAADVVEPVAVAPDEPAAALAGTPVQERDEERAARSAREVAPTALDEELAKAHWVEGRVVFPPGTPGDEDVWVVADGRNFPDGSDHRARVAPDGAFRVAFSERSRAGTLGLDARYLRLASRVGWKRDDDQRPVVLEPVLGGRVVVRARQDGGPAPAGEVGLLIMHTRNSWSQGNERLPFDADGLAAFDALEVDTEVRPTYHGPELVGEAEAVVVERGVTVEATLRLEPGAVLGGRVVDEAGEPIAGASVGAFPLGVMSSRRPIESAEDGAFRTDALPHGRIGLRVEHEGYETLVEELALERGERRTDLALVLSRGGTIAGVVRWPDGTPAEAELVLEPASSAGLPWEQMQPVEGKALAGGRFRVSGLSAPAYLVRARATSQSVQWSARADAVDVGTEDLALVLERGGSVSGVVVDDRGALVADFRVAGWRPASDLTGIRMEGDVSRELEAAGGAFSFEDLEPGAWRFAAIGSQHASSEVVVVDVPTTQRVELRTPRAARVRGVVLDAAGEPCPHVTLSVERPGSHGFMPYDLAHGWKAPVTDADGAFVLEPLRPGPVVLTGADRRGSTIEPLALDLEPGVEVRDVVLRLRDGASIVVEVVDRAGRPVEGALVQVFPSGRARTDASGSVELVRLAPGRSYVQTEVDGMGLQQTVDLVAGETVRVRLALPTTAPVRLRGRATVDGAPLRGGRLWASPYGPPSGEASVGTSSATTAADGSYALTLPGPGEYTVSLSRHDGAVSFSQRFQVVVPPVAEHALDLDVALGRIAGTVADASGTPLSAVQLTAVTQGPGFTGAGLPAGGQAHARTGTDGRYELALPAGTYVVAAGGPQWSTNGGPQYVEQRSSPIEVAAGGHVRGVDFVLRPGAVLEGRVRTADGSRFEGATVCTGDRPVTWAQADGLFRVDAIEPGVHWVRAFSSGYTTAEPARVEVGLDEPARVELVLVPSTYVKIRVRDASGGQLAGTVTVLDADGRPLPTIPTNDGVVAGLTPGTYTARATVGGASASRELGVKEGESLEVEIVVE